jgi:hypothetical protein
MPYIDITDSDQFQTLLTRYAEAHPREVAADQAAWAAQARGGKRRPRPMPSPFSRPMPPETLRKILAWGRQHHLVTRRDAEAFAERYGRYHSDPGVVVQITPAPCGTPPREQAAVRLEALLQWVHLTERRVTGGVELLTLPEARAVLRNLAKDPEVHSYPRERAAFLAQWLREQEQAQTRHTQGEPAPQLALFDTNERSV